MSLKTRTNAVQLQVLHMGQHSNHTTSFEHCDDRLNPQEAHPLETSHVMAPRDGIWGSFGSEVKAELALCYLQSLDDNSLSAMMVVQVVVVGMWPTSCT